MPTLAAVTGNASAAGYILALTHDYVLMRSDRGLLYMSELDIKLVIPAWFFAVIKAKVGSPAARRRIVMQAVKLSAAEALRLDVIDSAHVEAAVSLTVDLVKCGWNGHMYAENCKTFLGHGISS